MKLTVCGIPKRTGISVTAIFITFSIMATNEYLFSYRKHLRRLPNFAADLARKNPFIGKNITLADGEIFKFNSYIALEVDNDITVLKSDQCYTGKARTENKTGKFVLLSNFVFFKHKNYRSNLHFAGKVPTTETLEARIMEIVDVIQANLLHPYIEEFYLFVSEQEAVDFLRRIEFQNGDKLVLKLTSTPVTLKIEILYASKCLKNRTIALSNQDNKFGTGWDHFNPDILRRNKILYALTRHSALSRCKGSTGSANCDPGYPYIGSHDTFIFNVRDGFTSEQLRAIDKVSANLPGMENVFMWMFETQLGFTVLNPCPILKVHHHHCVMIRDNNRRRINTGGKNAVAGFTHNLE